MLKASQDFVPVFIDTLKDIPTTERFEESVGSYPVLRVHDLEGHDIGGRIDSNPTAGNVSATEIVEQFQKALERFHHRL